MAIRVAVATSDGIWVDQHFGRARRFAIYRCDEEGFEALETRESPRPCNGREHDGDRLARAVERLADCGALVVRAVGPEAVDLLLARRIRPFTAVGTVEEALWDVIRSKRLTYLKQEGTPLP